MSLVPSSDNTVPLTVKHQPPSHLSEATFRKYEHSLTKAIAEFPRDCPFDPSLYGVAPTTFAARMRDSILSVLQYNWPTTINVEKLRTIAGQYIISHERDGTVWFRQKERRGRPLTLTGKVQLPPQGTDTTPPPDWSGADLSQLIALCTLLHHERVTGPFRMDFCPDPADIADLMERYNVAIFRDSLLNKTIVQ